MEMNEFADGYEAALNDVESKVREFREAGVLMVTMDIEYLLSNRRLALASFRQITSVPVKFGSEFCKTIYGTSTGPQDGLRRGTHAS